MSTSLTSTLKHSISQPVLGVSHSLVCGFLSVSYCSLCVDRAVNWGYSSPNNAFQPTRLVQLFPTPLLKSILCSFSFSGGAKWKQCHCLRLSLQIRTAERHKHSDRRRNGHTVWLYTLFLVRAMKIVFSDVFWWPNPNCFIKSTIIVSWMILLFIWLVHYIPRFFKSYNSFMWKNRPKFKGIVCPKMKIDENVLTLSPSKM